MGGKQEALVDFLCQDLEKEDRLVFFLTSEAKEKNAFKVMTEMLLQDFSQNL